ncbi:M20/M25/M40 family metallo-hydrolase [Agrilutibacter solisilvae]|uniref:M20/M25/M40 family metallo-hydrolase n=1 Tax=Agrilutibacter solisilvae TaxID=2763317 RepID=A0A974XWN6_9GAMM|nr:M20/M25/M40 family metallo-hydrolase [Lysobacter solisilvae]QSX77098.1 M20/M25/M40 family metallo-hydrolase [Lysobacter solisilvae]
MNCRSLFLLGLSAALLSGASAAVTAPPDDHDHARGQRARLGVQYEPMATVHIVTSRATWEGGVRLIGRDARAARDNAGRDLVIASVRAHQLDDVSRLVHERERRCGGYFAFASRAQALAFLRQDRTVQAMHTKALAAYTIDNDRTVAPWIAQVEEPRIRATISHLSTAYPNRYYASVQGHQSPQWIRDTWLGLGVDRSDVSVETTDCANCGGQQSIILTVRGARYPDEIVVVGGHQDSISDSYNNGVMDAPGADDDASGIATITEVIRIALASGWRPQRTVKFMAYAAEEVGLRGSHAIAQAHRAQGANVVGVLQLDMTNYTAGSALSMRLISDFSNAALQQFVLGLFDHYLAPTGLTRGGATCGYACSDHASWTSAGYPSAFVAEPTLFPYRHTPLDNLQQIGPTAASSVNFAKLALAFVGELAKTDTGTTHDFDGDGRSDVFWRNVATGANDVWRSADARTRQYTSPVANLAWQVAGIGDLDGDHRADVVWRNASTGANDLWPSAQSSQRRALATVPDTGWKLEALGDFGQRGAADLFWRHAVTGQIRVWVGGDAAQAQTRVPVANPDWRVVGAGDFDLDGHDDVLWRNRATGANDLWLWGTSERRRSLTAVTNTAWQVVGVADFNGDRRADILWRHAGTGANVIWFSANAATQRVLASVSDLHWTVAGVGDYSGDGQADILWRHATLGYDDLWLSADSTRRLPLTRVSDVDWRVMR